MLGQARVGWTSYAQGCPPGSLPLRLAFPLPPALPCPALGLSLPCRLGVTRELLSFYFLLFSTCSYFSKFLRQILIFWDFKTISWDPFSGAGCKLNT